MRDLFSKCQTWKGIKCKLTVTEWPYIPQQLREYIIIENYIPIDNFSVIEKKLSTTKSVNCRFDCDCNSM